MKILLLLTILSCCLSVINADGYIHYLSQRYPEAVCLDGSSAALYVFPGSVKTSVIFSQEGGGLCTSPETCYQRSLTGLGSSTGYPATVPDSSLSGILSRNCTANPNFCHFSVVFLKYCDGSIYASSLDGDVDYQGHKLYFKGDVIRKAAISHLAELLNINKVDEMIYSGDSAGGYSTFIHSDIDIGYLGKKVPSLQKVAAIPLSGLFPVAPNVEGVDVVEILSQQLMKMANATHSANPVCTAAKSPAMQYTCSNPVVAYNYSTVPTFVLQSHTDAWQVFCELGGILTDNNTNEQCLGAPLYANTGCPDASSFTGQQGVFLFRNCNQTQMDPIIAYQQIALVEMKKINGFLRPENGVFMVSCLSHVASESWHWTGTRIKGIPMNQATWNWWFSLPKSRKYLVENVLEGKNNNNLNADAAGSYVYVDCVRTGAQNGNMFWECNPTCVNPA